MAQLMEFLFEGSKAGRVENVARYHVAPRHCFLRAISMWISPLVSPSFKKNLCDQFFLAKLAFATGVEDNPLMEGACFCGCGAWVGEFMVTLMLVNQCLPDIPHKERVTMGYEPPFNPGWKTIPMMPGFPLVWNRWAWVFWNTENLETRWFLGFKYFWTQICSPWSLVEVMQFDLPIFFWNGWLTRQLFFCCCFATSFRVCVWNFECWQMPWSTLWTETFWYSDDFWKSNFRPCAEVSFWAGIMWPQPFKLRLQICISDLIGNLSEIGKHETYFQNDAKQI